jgi:hypothetical protein
VPPLLQPAPLEDAIEMKKPEGELDRERVTTILKLMLEIIRASYERGPPERARYYDALNAMAMAQSTNTNIVDLLNRPA